MRFLVLWLGLWSSFLQAADDFLPMPSQATLALGINTRGIPSDSDIALIKKAGFHWLRVGVRWAGVEGCPSDTMAGVGLAPHRRGMCCKKEFVVPQPAGFKYCQVPEEADAIFDPENPKRPWGYKPREKGLYSFSDELRGFSRMRANRFRLAISVGAGKSDEHPLYNKMCPIGTTDRECRAAEREGALVVSEKARAVRSSEARLIPLALGFAANGFSI